MDLILASSLSNLFGTVLMDFESTEQAQLFPSVVADPTVFYNLADEHTFPDCPIKEEQLDTTSNGSSQTPTTNGSFKEHDALQFGVNGEVASAKHDKINPKLRLFQCAQCLKCLSIKDRLKEHLRIHTGEKPFSCEKCGMMFRHCNSFKKHQASAYSHQVHSVERPFKCARCLSGFGRRGNLLNHLLVHTGEKPHQCQTCGARFRQLGNLVDHQTSVHSAAALNHKCDECDKTFNRQWALIKHRRLEHPLKCARCLACFGLRAYLSRHLLIHTGERPYQCQTCGARFRQLGNLVDHQTSVHSAAALNHKCDECDKTYKNRLGLMQHKRIVHKCADRPYKCARCLASFSLRAYLSRHILIHTGEKPHQCQVCGARFSQSAGLTIHQAIHSTARTHQCDECDKTFKHRSGLNTHKRFAHELPQLRNILDTLPSQQHTEAPAISPLQCEQCGRTCRSRSQLIIHQTSHSTTRNHQCDECDKTYKSRSTLTQHKRLVHELPQLRRNISDEHPHTQTTTGKPIQCEKCGKTFKHPSGLHQHKLLVHELTQLRRSVLEVQGHFTGSH